MSVVVELFGPARQRAGTPEVTVDGHNLGQALQAVERACPALAGTVWSEGGLSPHCKVSLNGRRFVRDAELTLRHGDRLIVLAAEAGG